MSICRNACARAGALVLEHSGKTLRCVVCGVALLGGAHDLHSHHDPLPPPAQERVNHRVDGIVERQFVHRIWFIPPSSSPG